MHVFAEQVHTAGRLQQCAHALASQARVASVWVLLGHGRPLYVFGLG